MASVQQPTLLGAEAKVGTDIQKSSDTSAQDVGNPLLQKWRAQTEERSLNIEDFDFGRTIGMGRYARVRLAKLKKTSEAPPFCIKVLKKTDMVKLEQVDHILNEKDCLGSSQHPFIIVMFATFQDASRLYMALELGTGGELFNRMRAEKKFPLAHARFYISEVIAAITHLHNMLIVFRDLKPENVLISRDGHVKLTDFGFAKYLKGDKTHTLCGTPAYMAPEIIKRVGHGLPVDWWSVGIFLFEMLSAHTPFKAIEEQQMFVEICNCHVQYPPTMDNDAKDFCRRLITFDPANRLGSPECRRKGGIHGHAFFKTINWEDVNAGKLTPPWLPGQCDANGNAVDEDLFGKFEESDNAATGLASVSLSAVELSAGAADPYTEWEQRRDLRTEALELADNLAQARLKQVKQREEEKRREEEHFQEEQRRKEEEKKKQDQQESQAKDSDHLKVQSAEEKKACCTVQ